MNPEHGPEVLQTLQASIIAEGLAPETLTELARVAEVLDIPAGTLLIQQGAPADCMYVVIKGRLEASVERQDGSHRILGEISDTEVVGEKALVRGGTRRAHVRAEEPTRVIALSRAMYASLAADHPALNGRLVALMERRDRALNVRRYRPAAPELLGLARRSSLLAGLDDAEIVSLQRQLQWVIIDGGGVLISQGDPGDSMYVVISGRLRTLVKRPDGTVEALGEMFPGELAGEISILTAEPRMATVVAVRDSELLRLSKSCFERLTETHPAMALHLARAIAARHRREVGLRRAPLRSRTVALVAAHPGIDLPAFASRLAASTRNVANVLHVNQERCSALLGSVAQSLAPDDPYHAEAIEQLNALETGEHDLIFFEADRAVTHWTRRCLRQADEIVLVAHADDDPAVSAAEAAIRESTHGSPRFHLVLLHEPHVRQPRGTHAWLRTRSLFAHHHVRVDRSGDFERLARLLTGHATALVLSGGGARGFAHIGVIRAIEELGLPIDAIGGTSMGAMIAAQFALGWSSGEMLLRNHKAWIDDEPLNDYTFPLLSLLTGRRVIGLCRSMFGETRIEDLWRPYFCVSTNLTRATADAHRQGELVRWVRASLSLPGIGPPLFHEGEVHVDGGVLNNLPGDEMRKICDGQIIAVDCGQQHQLSAPLDLPEPPGTWRLFLDRFRRGNTTTRVPRIMEILLRSSMLAADRLAEKVRAEVALCLRPPVQHIGTLQFDAIEEIMQIGHADAAPRLRDRMDQR
jgi:predicted acylesterase/phospholipase RssA/CRP-like cAMP-binding protein